MIVLYGIGLYIVLVWIVAVVIVARWYSRWVREKRTGTRSVKRLTR